VDGQPRVGQDERPDLAPAMDRATIPEEHHGSPQMAKQMSEKGSNVEPGKVPRLAAQVQGHLPVFRRHRHAAADREPIVPVAVEQARCLPAGCPGAADVGDEQEATLIDEDEVGAAARGVFLSGAIPARVCAPPQASLHPHESPKTLI
jgi:hypothetical protein